MTITPFVDAIPTRAGKDRLHATMLTKPGRAPASP